MKDTTDNKIICASIADKRVISNVVCVVHVAF